MSCFIVLLYLFISCYTRNRMHSPIIKGQDMLLVCFNYFAALKLEFMLHRNVDRYLPVYMTSQNMTQLVFATYSPPPFLHFRVVDSCELR
jgi:hypothetical protein